jgi:AcrR family transcriptional regulator
MPKPSHREKILTEGLRVVHERGFAGTSVRDIVQAAGVPQGSFTNHFASKEAFGLEVLDLYFARGCELMRETLRNDALPPLQRLGLYRCDRRTASTRTACEAVASMAISPPRRATTAKSSGNGWSRYLPS